MFVAEFFRGLGAYWRANQIIFRYRLWPYLVVPGLLSLIFVGGLIVAAAIFFDDLAAFITRNLLPASMNQPAMEILTSILLGILLLLLGFMAYKHVVLLLFSPILAYLSEQTEELLLNQPPPDFRWKNLFRDLGRSAVLNLRNLLFTVVLMALVWPLVFVPVVGAVLSTGLILLIQAYYGGFGLVDVVLERKRFSVRASVDFARRHRSRLTGVGVGFLLLLAIPLVGWFLAPAYGAVAATAAALDKIPPEKKIFHPKPDFRNL